MELKDIVLYHNVDDCSVVVVSCICIECFTLLSNRLLPDTLSMSLLASHHFCYYACTATTVGHVLHSVAPFPTADTIGNSDYLQRTPPTCVKATYPTPNTPPYCQCGTIY